MIVLNLTEVLIFDALKRVPSEFLASSVGDFKNSALFGLKHSLLSREKSY